MSIRSIGTRAARRTSRALAEWADRSPTPELTGPAPQPDPVDVAALFAWLRTHGSTVRAPYLWGVLHAARAASSAGLDAVSAVEFGVAGGNGLLELEAAARTAEDIYAVRVDVVGFDSGAGMPAPVDHRDVPWAIEPGWLAMDEAALRARLTRTELVIGAVADTVTPWLDGSPSPVGFLAFDLDYHSSTIDAFRVLEADDAALLPRVVCYFDDVLGYGWSDFNGERAAIADFNTAHDLRKIGKIHGLRFELPEPERDRPWGEQMYLAHLFDHCHYDDLEQVVPAGFLDGNRLV